MQSACRNSEWQRLKNWDLTEEISKSEQEVLEENSEQIDYDIDFEEPEDFSEEQDNGYFDIKDESEPEESEFSEIETQADETELSEDDFEIKGFFCYSVHIS